MNAPGLAKAGRFFCLSLSLFPEELAEQLHEAASGERRGHEGQDKDQQHADGRYPSFGVQRRCPVDRPGMLYSE